jgi:hypothetical protein
MRLKHPITVEVTKTEKCEISIQIPAGIECTVDYAQYYFSDKVKATMNYNGIIVTTIIDKDNLTNN